MSVPLLRLFQDGTFSVSDFTDAFQENDVQRVLRAYPDTITMHIHCPPVGDWKLLPQKRFAKLCRISINPPNVINPNSDKVDAFIGGYLFISEKVTFVTPLNNVLLSFQITCHPC